MGKDYLIGGLVKLVHGEIHNEAELEGILIYKVKLVTEPGADNTCILVGGGGDCIADEEDGLSLFYACKLYNFLFLLVGENLGNGVVLEGLGCGIKKGDVGKTCHFCLLLSEVKRFIEEPTLCLTGGYNAANRLVHKGLEGSAGKEIG